MANNPIPDEVREEIEELSEKGYAIYRIAKITGTCRPTVRKYGKFGEEKDLDEE